MSQPGTPDPRQDVSREGAGGATERNVRVLLTGAGGFVGGYVLRELLDRGYRPVCIVRRPPDLAARLPAEIAVRCEIGAGDLFDTPALLRAAAGCAAAIHLVGIIEEKPAQLVTFERIHVEATRCVLDACRASGIRRYVHMSALNSRPDAPSRYHKTKWQAEELVRESGTEWTIFRPSVIHGPDGEFMRMMKFFCTGGLRQPVMPYFGSGNARLQPVSVRDVATCFVAALSRPETIGKTYDLGGPAAYTWREVYDICAEAIVGHRRLKMPVPVFVARLMARTIVPLTPSFLMPHKFNVEQVQMSQEDNICDIGPVERYFGIRLREFREELREYANRIP